MGMSKLKCVKGLFSGRHFDREVILLCTFAISSACAILSR
jgi:hypothetical protein